MKAIAILFVSFVGVLTWPKPCYVLPVDEGKCNRIFQFQDSVYRKRAIWGLATPIKRSYNYMVFGIPRGTEVKSFASGKVVSIKQQTTGLGNSITISHKNSLTSTYGHLDTILVQLNQKITCGDLIAKSGNTGLSTAPCLHFKVKRDSVAINPMELIETED